MIRRPPRSTPLYSSAASDVYKRQLYMNGKEIFRKAVKVVIDSAQKAITDAGLTADDIDLMVPHQANLRIISAACQRLGIPEEKAVVVIDHYGNTSSASILSLIHI